MSTFSDFKTLVHQRCGLHLEGLAEARLTRAIDSLQASTGLSDATQLLNRLMSDVSLFDLFVSQLTVNETYFYREPDALNWLVNRYLPQRLASKDTPLSILSAGCSSGEEPYSLAMMLFERFGERAKTLFRLTGGDVDHQVLTKARRAVYSGMAFRALSDTVKERYFTPHEGRFKLNDDMREWVSFCPLNLLNAHEISAGGPFDVILFRNVSIYFDEQTRRHIQQQLSQLLAPNGILLCGLTETLGNDLGVFELTDDNGIFYFRHAAPAAALPTTPPLVPLLGPPIVVTDNQDSGMTEPAAHRFDDALTTTSSVDHRLDNDGGHLSLDIPSEARLDDADQQLLTAHRLLNQNAFSDAATLLTSLLQQQPWSVDALLLSGLVARWHQQPTAAFDHFKRAIYAAPECWPAHFYIAELYRQGELKDDPVQRQRSYAAVVRILTAAPTSQGGLATITLPIPPGDARFLAERYLNDVNTSLASTSHIQGVS